MMKKYYIYFIVLALVVVGGFIYKRNSTPNAGVGYKNASYRVDGKIVNLVNGLSQESIVPGSASKVTTRYFGNSVEHDFDNDGREDIAFLLTQDFGGSGTFYYVVVALNKENGYVGTDATIIGDRIAPQTTEVNDKGFIVVNYADRNPGEDFSVKPSLGKSLWFKFDPQTGQLGEVVQNFEGESR